MNIQYTKHQIQEAVNCWSQQLGKMLNEDGATWSKTNDVNAIYAIVSKIMQEIAYAIAFNKKDNTSYESKKIRLPMRRSSNIKAYAISMQDDASEHDLFVDVSVKPNILPQTKSQKTTWQRIFNVTKDSVECTSIDHNEFMMARLVPGRYSFNTSSWKIVLDVINDGCYAYVTEFN